MALMKYCNRTGCNKLVPQGIRYCLAHTIDTATENRQQRKKYDTHYRNQKAKKFYNSTAWRTIRERVLARDNNIDIYLYILEDRIVPADTVHHIVELIEDESKRLDIDNLISVSWETHSIISREYKDKAKREAMQKTLKGCMMEYRRRLAG